jgi:L-iditol 2-dehydrogenase
MAPSVVTPVTNLHEVPAWLDDATATLSEPLACICNAMMDPAAVQAGQRVLVIGPGAMGLLAAQTARACGGSVVIRGAERDQARLSLAKDLGFEVTHAGEGAGLDVEPGVDVVVECSGSEEGLRHGLSSLAPGGTFVQVGLNGGDVSMRFDLVCLRELAIRSGFASTPKSWRTAMQLIGTKRVDLAPLISEVMSLAEWERGFRASRDGEGVKYILDPRF